MITALDCMKRAMETYKARGKVYKKNYLTNGAIIQALFPNGKPVSTTMEDFNRDIVLYTIIVKLARYCENYTLPHIDSIHDLGVYAFILEELDTNLKEKEKP